MKKVIKRIIISIVIAVLLFIVILVKGIIRFVHQNYIHSFLRKIVYTIVKMVEDKFLAIYLIIFDLSNYYRNDYYISFS